MRYEWEVDAIDRLGWRILKINDRKIDDDFAIIGFAVENERTGEAAFFCTLENDGSVLFSDLFMDVKADVEDIYYASVEKRKRK